MTLLDRYTPCSQIEIWSINTIQHKAILASYLHSTTPTSTGLLQRAEDSIQNTPAAHETARQSKQNSQHPLLFDCLLPDTVVPQGSRLGSMERL